MDHDGVRWNISSADTVRRLEAERDQARSERDEARELAVWAVRHGACAGYDGSSWPCITYAPNTPVTYEHHKMSDLVNYDGTDAGIPDALRRAKGGE